MSSCDCLWKPESICVFAGEGKPPIDIIGYLKDQNHPHSELMGHRKRLEFPSEIYPPSPASRDIIEDAIIHAAAKVDVHLIKVKTVKMPSGKFATLLSCSQSRVYYPRNDAVNIPKNVYEDVNSGEQTLENEGIPHDNFINRLAAQRKGGKHGGKGTYYYTSKPPPDQTCSFQVRICLDPGNCWYLPPWAGNVYHNHEKLGPDETRRRRKVTISPNGGVIYEVTTPLGEDCGRGAESTQELVSVPMVHRNSNFYDATMAKITALLHMIQACHSPELEDLFTKKFDAFIGQMQELVIENYGNDSSLSGDDVTLSDPVDGRPKCKRIKTNSVV